MRHDRALVKRVGKEILIEAALIKAVSDLGGVAEKVSTVGSRGFFDRLVVLPGKARARVIFCELKRPKGGTISPHQHARHALYKKLGAEVALIKSEEDIVLLLRRQEK